jgi:hypothetical protein
MIPGYDPDYLRVYEHLVRRSVREGKTPVVLVATRTAATPVDGFHRRVLQFFGTPFPGQDLQKRLEEARASFLKN